MTESAFQQLLDRYLAGHCTPQEGRLVERLYEELGRAGGPEMSPLAQEKLLAAMWQRLEARTELPVPEAPYHPAAFWQAPARRWAAAALVVLTASASAGLLVSVYSPKTAPRQTAAGSGWTRRTNATRHEQALVLPDGSQVLLQPGSSLRYASGLAGPKREVFFSGDAFFKVHKNPSRPFLVFTSQVVTTVLGTSFRVQALAGNPNATVTVREGRVSVQARAGAQLDATPNRPAVAGVLLLPNQQVVYSGKANQLHKELAAAPAVLVPQSFVFDARPVVEVLQAIEEGYGVAIAYDRDALAECTVTLNLSDKSLAGKLDVLCEALGASYEESGTRILFHSKGCRNKQH